MCLLLQVTGFFVLESFVARVTEDLLSPQEAAQVGALCIDTYTSCVWHAHIHMQLHVTATVHYVRLIVTASLTSAPVVFIQSLKASMFATQSVAASSVHNTVLYGA